MAGLLTEREAKEYLAGRIVDEAKREGAPLSEVERKMLYFTESGWTLPDIMTVNEEFDRDYDQDVYEQKIGALVGKIQARDAALSERDQAGWDDAVIKLSEGDHYLLVLIRSARSSTGVSAWLPALSGQTRRPPGDTLRLIVVAFIVIVLSRLGFAVATYLRVRFQH